uniref:DUF4219 domain-containing protein n=1 Tax=Trichogramma kaykai TaxID=54128 RepID=A0ABD2WCQ2_9HYME
MSENQYVMHTPRFELLSRDNYDTWRIQVEALLIKNDGWDFVSDATPAPAIEGADATALTAAEAAYKAWLMKLQKSQIRPDPQHFALRAEGDQELQTHRMRYGQSWNRRTHQKRPRVKSRCTNS